MQFDQVARAQQPERMRRIGREDSGGIHASVVTMPVLLRGSADRDKADPKTCVNTAVILSEIIILAQKPLRTVPIEFPKDCLFACKRRWTGGRMVTAARAEQFS
jgi:hypothetical protein